MSQKHQNGQNHEKHQKWPKIAKNRPKMTKITFFRKMSFLGGPAGGPPGPKKKASLSNRRIGTRNTDSYMVSIQKGSFLDPPCSGCARPPKKGRIKAKLKFFFELLKKTLKNRIFCINLTNFDDFWPFLTLFR